MRLYQWQVQRMWGIRIPRLYIYWLLFSLTSWHDYMCAFVIYGCWWLAEAVFHFINTPWKLLIGLCFFTTPFGQECDPNKIRGQLPCLGENETVCSTLSWQTLASRGFLNAFPTKLPLYLPTFYYPCFGCDIFTQLNRSLFCLHFLKHSVCLTDLSVMSWLTFLEWFSPLLLSASQWNWEYRAMFFQAAMKLRSPFTISRGAAVSIAANMAKSPVAHLLWCKFS